MKTYYDITINSQSGDVINIKGVSYSQMMKIVNDNPTLQKLEILKEYLDDTGFTSVGIESGLRAENLSVEQFVSIANFLA